MCCENEQIPQKDQKKHLGPRHAEMDCKMACWSVSGCDKNMLFMPYLIHIKANTRNGESPISLGCTLLGPRKCLISLNFQWGALPYARAHEHWGWRSHAKWMFDRCYINQMNVWHMLHQHSRNRRTYHFKMAGDKENWRSGPSTRLIRTWPWLIALGMFFGRSNSPTELNS